MKIGILDIIGGPLATLLNQLTEAGRLKNMLNDMNGEPGSGNTKVDNQLKKLNVIKKAGGSDYIFNSTLNGMMEDYNRQIMAIDAQIKNGGKPVGGGSGSSQDVRYLQQKMDALKVMRDQLAAGAKELSKPIIIETNTGGVVGGSDGGGRSGGGVGSAKANFGENIAFNPTSDASMKYDPNQYFQSIWEMIGEAGRKQIAETLDKQWDYGKDISKEWKVDSKGNLINKPENRAQESMARDLRKFTGYAEKTLGGVSSIVGGLSQLGIEIPKGLQDVLGGIQGIISITTGIASLVAMIEALTTVQTTESTIKSIPIIGWALAGGGIIHAASGYEVPGNYYSGDQVPALLNSGELVLNKAQQNALANELQGNGMQNLNLHGVVEGEKILLVVNRSLKRKGKGELVTWKD